MKRIAGLASIALVCATLASAQGLGPHGPHGPGGPDLAAHLTKMLDLSPDQQSKVEGIVSKYTEGALGDKMRSMHEARGTLAATVHDANASDKQVQEAAGVVSAIEAQLAVEQHHMAVEISGVLTADQKAKLAQMARAHGDHDGPPPPDGSF